MHKNYIEDSLFSVQLIAHTPDPLRIMYGAMHQDYCSEFVEHDYLVLPQDVEEILERKILNPMHMGVLEHIQLNFECGYFPHSVMQQVRTHRIGITFDVQSFRYTSESIIDFVSGKRKFDQTFYLRPIGTYKDRDNPEYEYTDFMKSNDIKLCRQLAEHYVKRVETMGVAPEHARGLIPFDYRQHFRTSMTLRTALHMLDMRAKPNAQPECMTWAYMLFESIKQSPELAFVANWYEKTRLGKGRLAP